MSVYNGTIYQLGDTIPGYVETIHEMHVWYDQSKSYNNGTNIFNELFVSEGMMLGDEEDDIWQYDEILEEIMRYLNLHIIQLGADIYIFDWDTARSGGTVVWKDIFTGDTKTEQYTTVIPSLSTYAADDTQLSNADVYNQIVVEDNPEKFDDIITSPLDSEDLISLCGRQHYMDEYAAVGGNMAGILVLYLMLTDQTIPPAETGDDDNKLECFIRQWWVNVKSSAKWRFYLNGNDCYNSVPTDANGKYYDQWRLCDYLFNTPFASGIVSFGKGDKINTANYANIENITSFTDYLVINVNGSGRDECSTTQETYDTWTLPTQFPTANDLQNANMNIEYINPTDGNYSPADPTVTNYLVFSGKITMATQAQRTGSYGFDGDLHWSTMDNFNVLTEKANANKPNVGNNKSIYFDWGVFKRKDNTAYMLTNLNDVMNMMGRAVPSGDSDKGQFLTHKFYNHSYPTDTETFDLTKKSLVPLLEQGDLSRRMQYDLTGKHSYWHHDGGIDVIPFVDVLACQLQIGDKYCEEYHDASGNKQFRWVTEQQLIDRGYGEGYEVLPNGTTMYKAYINIAIDINNGQWLLGQAHDIYNNIPTSANIDKKGMGIPMKNSDSLSGEMKFRIVGLVNNTWDQGCRRHPTWFRHTTYTPNSISILPHVGQIWIEKFNVDMVSDNGKNPAYDKDNKLIYMSDEQNTYMRKKDDITFKFTTAVSQQEAAQMGVNIEQHRSDIADTDGNLILSITNNITQETDKPEKHYVDAYYREYKEPMMIMESTMHNSDYKPFDKFYIRFLDKYFYVINTETNVKNNTIKYTLKEIHS